MWAGACVKVAKDGPVKNRLKLIFLWQSPAGGLRCPNHFQKREKPMSRKTFQPGLCLVVLALTLMALTAPLGAEDITTLMNPESGRAWFVSGTAGNNGNDGTKEAPLKNIDRAVKNAAAGDTILVAEGAYTGTFGVGYIKIDKPLKLYGSFAPDFSARDINTHTTLFQPNNKSAAKAREPLITLQKNIDGTVLDGFVLDMGMRNSYSTTEGKPEGVETGMLLLPPAKNSGDAATVEKPILFVPSATQGGNLTVRNNVFINGANFGIQAGLRSGKTTITDNLFVANRMAAIEVFGTSGQEPGEVEIAYNTILFTWSRLDDFQDMGYGVRIMTKLKYDIHHNIIGGNIKGGVDHRRYNKDEWIKVDNNTFFVNKTADFSYSPESNVLLDLSVGEMVDVPLASVSGNKGDIPQGLKVNEAYLDGYLNARYSEETDLDRDSPANQWRSVLGLNLVGTIETSVSMFGNRYPWKEALGMFGAVDGVGARKP